jgi:hypothetical protein
MQCARKIQSCCWELQQPQTMPEPPKIYEKWWLQGLTSQFWNFSAILAFLALPKAWSTDRLAEDFLLTDPPPHFQLSIFPTAALHSVIL